MESSSCFCSWKRRFKGTIDKSRWERISIESTTINLFDSQNLLQKTLKASFYRSFISRYTAWKSGVDTKCILRFSVKVICFIRSHVKSSLLLLVLQICDISLFFFLFFKPHNSFLSIILLIYLRLWHNNQIVWFISVTDQLFSIDIFFFLFDDLISNLYYLSLKSF